MLLLLFRFFTACLLTLQVLPAAAQTKSIAALKAALANAPTPHQQLVALRQLLEKRNSLNIDTLYYYARQTKALALQLNNTEAAAYAEQDIALHYAAHKRMDTAIAIIAQQLDRLSPTASQELRLSLKLAHSRLLYRNNQYKESLEGLFAVDNLAEKLGNTPYQVMAKTGIGWLQLDMKQYTDALSWFYKALNTPGSTQYLSAYAALYSNLATTHQALRRTDSALFYIRKAIGNARKDETLGFLATSLRIYAEILLQQKQTAEAQSAMEEVVKIRRVTDGSFFVNYDMSLLAQLYAQTGQPQKGIALCKAVIDSALQSGITTQLYLVYDALAAAYKAAGEYKAYGETLERSKAFQDSLARMNTGQLIAGLQSANEIQRKEKVIIQQKLDIVQKRLLLYGLLALLAFATVLGVVLFRQYQKRQALRLRLLQEEEKRRAERAVLLAEEAERKRIAADLHDSLGAYAASIASNIYALEAGTTNTKQTSLQELRSNSQAIVSQLNDTIWVLKKDALSLTAISDRVKLFIQQLASSYPQVTIDVCEAIATDHLLPPAQAFHLFQIIKEAVINSLKHSRCRQILITLKAQESWRVCIADDGRGMAVTNTSTEGGNGLANMRQRAAESGWRIEWQGRHPAGTSVVVAPTTNLLLPTPAAARNFKP